MTLVADSAYISGDRTKLDQNTYNKRDPKYSGLVLYFSPKGKYLGGWRYKNGELVTTNAKTAPVDTKAQNTVNYKPAANEQAYCEDWWWITENEDGEITSVTYLYTICYYPGGTGGGADAPPPPPKCPGTSSLSGKAVAGNAPWEPGPTQPGDDGGFPPPPGSAGDGCAVQGDNPPVDTAQADTLIDTCAQIRQIKDKMMNAVISQQLTTLRQNLVGSTTSNFEKGYSQNLASWPSSNYDTTQIVNGSNQDINLPVTWRSDVGFTIGLIHMHPNGSQPSPQDAFTLLDPLKNADLVNGGLSAISYYKANFSATIVVYDAVYVMKIKDIAKLQALQNEFNSNKADFKERLETAIRSNGDLDAGFLSIFKDAVYLYKAGANDNSFKMTENGSDGFAKFISHCL